MYWFCYDFYFLFYKRLFYQKAPALSFQCSTILLIAFRILSVHSGWLFFNSRCGFPNNWGKIRQITVITVYNFRLEIFKEYLYFLEAVILKNIVAIYKFIAI